jgi:hypothetical protein
LSFTGAPPARTPLPGPADSLPPAAPAPTKVRPPDPWLASRDEAVFLLQTTAEVEHALLVQYLYAAYSLDSASPLLSADQKKAVGGWRNTIVGIAREEMAHLASMQNVLRLLGGPIHLDRQAFPYRSDLSPFAFRLEPLTLRSLARYVAAERPDPIPKPEDACLFEQEILPLALEENNEQDVNRVGALFDRLQLLFRDPGTQPDETPPVDDADIQTDVGDYLALASDWTEGLTRLIVGPAPADVTTAASARTAIRDVLARIAAQGEGNQSPADSPSHFDWFIGIWRSYRQFFPDSPSDDVGPGAPALAVPTDPSTRPAPGPSVMTNPKARRLAQLSNFRYRMILGYLQHFFLHSAHGPDLLGWIFDDMPALGSLARDLVKLPRTSVETLADRAAPPFELPYSIALPDREVERWRTHRDVLLASIRLLGEVIADGSIPAMEGTNRLNADKDRLSAIDKLIANPNTPATGTPPNPGGMPMTPQDAMLALIKAKQPLAKNHHAGVPASGGTLKDLFVNSKFDEILAFLLSGSAIFDPATGKKLVVPGKPDESGFFIQISSDDGVMAGRFTPAEIETVKQWILSLPTN